MPGLGTETDFLKVEASAAFDWRDNPLFPHAGGRYAVTAVHYSDRDLEQFDSHRIGVSLQQLVPLPNRYRRLAVRGEAVFTDADSGQTVPFYLQPTLGGARNLRGFREFRFRDRNAVLVGAETSGKPGGHSMWPSSPTLARWPTTRASSRSTRWRSRMVWDSGSTATARSSAGSTWPSAVKASSRF